MVFICLLFKNKMNYHIMGSNKLCAYYNPIKMWTFEVLPLRFDIINYIVPMWHVSSNKFQFYFWLSFGSCLCEFAWCGFSLICISIYYMRNHLFHFILTMALPVGLNNWNYQQTLVKYGILILISCHMLFVVKLVLNIIPI